jgi:hypothetical protein
VRKPREVGEEEGSGVGNGWVGPMIMVEGNVAAEKVDRNGSDEVEKPPD